MELKVSSLHDKLMSRQISDAKRPTYIVEKENARKLLLEDFTTEKISLEEFLNYLNSHVAKKKYEISLATCN